MIETRHSLVCTFQLKVMDKKFNIRVYGIYITDQQEVLLADEERFGMKFTKFPGGGLEFGEGPIGCLQRECREEMGMRIEVLEHFYTTDYFQPSAFHKDSQVISIYYRIDIPEFEDNRQSLVESRKDGDGSLSFRLVPVSGLSENDFTFPIDKRVAGLMKKYFTNQPSL